MSMKRVYFLSLSSPSNNTSAMGAWSLNAARVGTQFTWSR